MRRAILAVSICAATMVAAAAPAAAHPHQEGLVNVNVSDTTVQVPIAAAANLCNVSIAVLAEIVQTGGDCDADARAVAHNRGGGRGPAHQEGLVNVNVSDTTIQVPISAAINLCNVSVAVLAEIVQTGGDCDAVARGQAQN